MQVTTLEQLQTWAKGNNDVMVKALANARATHPDQSLADVIPVIDIRIQDATPSACGVCGEPEIWVISKKTLGRVRTCRQCINGIRQASLVHPALSCIRISHTFKFDDQGFLIGADGVTMDLDDSIVALPSGAVRTNPGLRTLIQAQKVSIDDLTGELKIIS